jgi:hypothetical protein
MAAVSRIRDPQRLVDLVADTMFRERTRAERVRGLHTTRNGRAAQSDKEDNGDQKEGG